MSLKTPEAHPRVISDSAKPCSVKIKRNYQNNFPIYSPIEVQDGHLVSPEF